MGIAAKVRKEEANRFRKFLLDRGLFDATRIPSQDAHHVYFPVTSDEPSFAFFSASIVRTSLRAQAHAKQSLRSYLSTRLTARQLEHARKSFDIVGSIIILETSASLRKHEKKIARHLLLTHPSVTTVVRKSGAHTGRFRIQNYVFIAGKRTFETLHKENGLVFSLDIRKTYFSARSAQERMRIAHLVKRGERVLVLFSGIAPYPLVISKHSAAREIIGIELNALAHAYGEKNVVLNKRKNITLLRGDAKKLIPRLSGTFDRIIMPLPKTAHAYLPIALRCVKKGGWIHLYGFAPEKTMRMHTEKKIMRSSAASKRRLDVVSVAPCGQQAPRVLRVCANIHVLS